MRTLWRALLEGGLASLGLLAVLLGHPTALAEAQGVGLFSRPDCATISSAVAGSTWCFDSTLRALRVYDGTTFATVTSLNAFTNVKDPPFSANGDGVTDDTAAINAAIAAIATTGLNPGGTVFFPKGTYLISAPLTLKTGLTVIGAGRQAVRILNNANTSAFKGTAALNGTREIKVANLFIDDNVAAVSRTAGHGIELDGTGDAVVVVLENLIINGHFDGVRLTAPIISSLRDVRVNICRNDGFAVYGLSTSTIFETTYANACVRHGYYVDGGAGYFSFYSTASDTNGGDAYHLERSSGGLTNTFFTFVSPGAEGNVGHAMYFRDGYGHTILSPKIATTTGVLKDGIRFDGTRTATVIGGEAFTTTGYGMNVLTSATPQTPTTIVALGFNAQSNTAGSYNDPNGVVTRFYSTLAGVSDAAQFKGNATAAGNFIATGAFTSPAGTNTQYTPPAGFNNTVNLSGGGAMVLQGGGQVFSADNTYDLGTAGALRPRSLYLGTSAIVGAPTGGDKGAGTVNSQTAYYANNNQFINASGTLINASVVFANLNLVLTANGMQVYCSDCTFASALDQTCVGGGSGNLAVRVNGVFKCAY